MIGFVLVILFALSFPCEGKIILPSHGNELVVAPGEDAKIAWTFDDTGTLVTRRWLNQTGGVLAQIIGDNGVLLANSSLPGVNVTKPGTLILKNVDLRHNQTYKFELLIALKATQSSDVTVFVAVNSNVTTNCSSFITLDEGGDVRCLCQAQGENPPVTMKVTWYKNGDQIGPTREEENMLSLINVNGTDSGTYKCKAKGDYDLTGESNSTEVIVNFKPVVTSLSPTKAELNKSVIITCEASAHPEANYTIYHNGSKVSDEKTYKIPVVNASHAGWYRCVAKNVHGSGSKTINVTVISEAPPSPTTTAKASTSTSSNSVGGTDEKGGSGGLGGGAIAGISIGVPVLSLIILFVVRRYKHNKEKESIGLSGNDANPENNEAQPPVYAAVDKSKNNDQSVTYATLATVAMESSGSSKRDRVDQPTEYASIVDFGVKIRSDAV